MRIFQIWGSFGGKINVIIKLDWAIFQALQPVPWLYFFQKYIRAVIKKGLFTARLTLMGRGEISLVGPDRKRMWKIWPILALKFDFFDTHDICHLIERGSKIHFIPFSWCYVAFYASAYCYNPTILWQSSSSKEELGILVVGYDMIWSPSVDRSAIGFVFFSVCMCISGFSHIDHRKETVKSGIIKSHQYTFFWSHIFKDI